MRENPACAPVALPGKRRRGKDRQNFLPDAQGDGWDACAVPWSGKIAVLVTSLDPEAFKSIKVGLQRSTTYDDWLKAKMPTANVMRYDTVEALFLDIKAGRVDTIMTNPMKAHDAFLEQGGLVIGV